MYPELTETERFPLLSADGRRFLHAMRQHSAAPAWNWPNGEQLDEQGLSRIQNFVTALHSTPVFGPDKLPDWLPSLVDFCLDDVPFFRSKVAPGTPFYQIPSCSRDDLAAGVWQFVPDSQSLDQLIVFSSSGTTGHPARFPTHPYTAACGIPLLEHALAPSGISFPRGVGQMALTNIAAYPGAYTTAIVMAYLQEAGCIRVNLHEADWRQQTDRRTFLDHWSAPIMLGDPIAFTALRHVGIEKPPHVMVSSILSMSDALANELTKTYNCQVLDLYAMTEAGIIAVRTPAGHKILPSDLYVEILDTEDKPCPPGVRGEVTLTGGRNPFTPLLRYRTGDYASLTWVGQQPYLVDLEGREPIVFRGEHDREVHSMEVSRALRQFPLVQFQLHQQADRGFRFSYRGVVNEEEIRTSLFDLLGRPKRLELSELPAATGKRVKVLQYTSALR